VSNEKIILCILGGVFLLGVLFRILFAALFPGKFADGARDVLFLEEREKALFRRATKNKGQGGNGPGDQALPDYR
jgi:hypothetical protein